MSPCESAIFSDFFDVARPISDLYLTFLRQYVGVVYKLDFAAATLAETLRQAQKRQSRARVVSRRGLAELEWEAPTS